MAIVEAYPEPASGQAMQKLQHELADTENRIAGAREFYNNAVTIVRNRRSTFPGVIVASFADPRRLALFATNGFERTVPGIEHNF